MNAIGTEPVDLTADIIDSRDIIARIDYLETDPESLEDEERTELATLTELARQGADYAPDWEYGEILIRDSYFEDYARQLAEDIGAIDPNAGWPLGCIDWERAAEQLQIDYTDLEVDGVTYWIR